MGSNIRSVFMKFLGIHSQFVGSLRFDDSIWKCNRAGLLFYEGKTLIPEVQKRSKGWQITYKEVVKKNERGKP